MNKYLNIKEIHKNLIINNKNINYKKIKEFKEHVFKKDNYYIYIGENKFSLEDLVLNKIPINKDVINSLEDESIILYNKFIFKIKEQLDLKDNLIRNIKLIDKKTKEIISYKNLKVDDLINIIKNQFNNIIPMINIFSDNVELYKNKILFKNGTRIILNNNEITIKELSPNYKVEIIFDRYYLSYVLLDDVLNTLDTFKIYFIDGTTQVKFIEDFSIKNKFINVNTNVNKIIIEGIGAKEICNDIKVCVGKNISNINEGCVVFEPDYTKTKITENIYIDSHEDIDFFIWDKSDVDFKLEYKDFKSTYYDFNKIIYKYKKIKIDLKDKYLIAFFKTNHSVLNEIKVYGVD